MNLKWVIRGARRKNWLLGMNKQSLERAMSFIAISTLYLRNITNLYFILIFWHSSVNSYNSSLK